MHPSSRTCAFVCLGAAFGLALYFVSIQRSGPVDARLLAVEDRDSALSITVEFRQRSTSALFWEPLKIQSLVSGGWQEVKAWPRSADGTFLFHTNVQRVVFSVPRRTEVCRFSLKYHVGSRNYCRAYGFLTQHGVYQAFPKICRFALRWTFRPGRARYVDPVVRIPVASHATSRLGTNRARPFLSMRGDSSDAPRTLNLASSSAAAQLSIRWIQ